MPCKSGCLIGPLNLCNSVKINPNSTNTFGTVNMHMFIFTKFASLSWSEQNFISDTFQYPINNQFRVSHQYHQQTLHGRLDERTDYFHVDSCGNT